LSQNVLGKQIKTSFFDELSKKYES